MAFLQRIRNNKLKTAFTQLKNHRCYMRLPHSSSINSIPKPGTLRIPQPYWAFHDTPPLVSSSVRFFAAPIQFQSKWKKEEEDSIEGRRLNDQIKAQYVRLVFDDGNHSIISRFEALDRARKLKLDLVEVQRNGNPPVVKIMDYHKETYKKQEKEKERAKSKSELTLRKGECKEVRFSGKTEMKDLKMKADMVKKLMEKGYRVKCRATGSDTQETTGALSRLNALIEDVTVVESGPSVAKKDVFMIVRHAKYGPKKGGGAPRKFQDALEMALKAQEDNAESLTTSSSDSIEHGKHSSTKYGFEAAEEVGGSEKNSRDRNNACPSDYQNITTSDSVSPPEPENRYKRADRNKVQSHAQAPPAATENRYQRAEPRNRYQQTSSNNTGFNNRGPGTRDAARPNNQYIPPAGSRYSRPPNTNQRPGFGFSNAQRGPGEQGGQAGMRRNIEGNPQDSTQNSFGRDSW
ncbi:hypothetical protein HN51_053235 [Arachis hypogaea]|uniref:Translation initiation factor 3 N-terminal domain-containing protein n=1 Tax=Arachis hypogaea TaxID=3818 RepID=A0A444XCD0_ARAHY|nr:translation initiation factor IF3-1, mitochondrial [Arachis ipaensis]XP_025676623.1 translation initiation factor IF3-1, mitochondrial [Arachis hypogaea]QHN75555.1 hypothetical protein DS421_19g636310 [Arachis hypogaea]RYQ87143.1 hypothetical protein Ahy_B09g094616 [Arachis hypogaea]